MAHYVILERIEENEFYDIAIVRFGLKLDIDDPDEGIILDIPIPKGINDTWVDHIITFEINKLMEYIDGKKT